MIGNIWTNKDKEELVKKRKKDRANLPFNHTMGSQSFAAAMSAQAKEHGQCPDIVDFYKLTHYTTKKKKWVTPICEQVHVQLEACHREDEHVAKRMRHLSYQSPCHKRRCQWKFLVRSFM